MSKAKELNEKGGIRMSKAKELNEKLKSTNEAVSAKLFDKITQDMEAVIANSRDSKMAARAVGLIVHSSLLSATTGLGMDAEEVGDDFDTNKYISNFYNEFIRTVKR